MRLLTLLNNQIENLSPLSELSGLESLDLANNSITSVSPLSGLTSLTELDLRNNQITDVSPLSGLNSLTMLKLSGNTGITNPEVLYKLRQGGTTITGVTIPDVVAFADTALETAVKSALNLQTSDAIFPNVLANLTTLSALNLSIADLTGLEGAMGLTTLTLSNNRIVDVLPLAGLIGLTELDLTGNPVSNPSVLFPLKQGGTTITGVTIPDTVVFVDAALGTAVRQALRIPSGAPIFPDVLAALTRLTATRKGITDLTGLEHATGLERLDLGNNAITNIAALANLIRLENLDLADNQITSISTLSSLTRLEVLDLRDNDVTDTALLSEMTYLKYLYVRGNANLSSLKLLVRLSEELLESLETLTASNNSITDLVGCEYMTALTSLDLQNNRITDVSPLSRLYSLETLMLDGNPIQDTSVLRELERRGTTIDITIYRYPFWDVNQDGDVDEADVFLITATITGKSLDVNGDGNVDADDETAADANKNGNVNTDDILLVFEKQDRPVNLGAPLLNAESAGLDWALLESIDADRLRAHLEILRLENDGSLKYQQAIAFLQAVLVAIQPNQTLLLANYPNPFNPETWIPYQLARDSNVWITIYDMRGVVVRRLELGYRAEGYYRVRGRAAHWDGRNEVDERVASGVYFYQLETDNLSLLRKMVILK